MENKIKNWFSSINSNYLNLQVSWTLKAQNQI